MLRSRILQRLFSRLALLAILLMLCAPQITGFLAQQQQANTSEGKILICTTLGLQEVDLALFKKSTTQSDAIDTAQPDHSALMMGECIYCLLATSIALLFTALLLGLIRTACHSPLTLHLILRTFLFQRQLSCRGPPITL